MYHKTRRILQSLALGLAIAAVAAPAAFAEPRGPGNTPTGETIRHSASPDDRSYYRGADWSLQAGARIVSPDDRSLPRGSESLTAPVSVSLSPDDRSLPRGTESRYVPVSVSLSPDDRALPRGTASASAPVSITGSVSDDFQWADAGIGAAATLTFVLLLGAAAILIRTQRRRIAAV